MSGAPSRIALTVGEPAGIGPDICIRLAQTGHDVDLVVVGDPDLLLQRARELRLPLSLDTVVHREYTPHVPGRLTVLPVRLRSPVVSGKLDPANAPYVIETLERAMDGCLRGEFDALVTAPVHKGVINDAGISFSGHTEFLAARCGAAQPVMLLAAGALRVALATTHLPLKEVAAAVTRERLVSVL